MLPVARVLLEALSHQPLLLIMDGSTVGRGCMTMMVSVIYGGRALPPAWCVVKGKKGHLSEDLHRALLAQVQTIVPTEATVIFMGDGEFDGIDLQADIRSYGRHYVCRTACNVLITAFGRTFPIGCLSLHPGQARVISEATMTQAQYGPVNALAVWEQDYEEPLFLVTSLNDAAQAFACYRRRPYIETFFSDQKSRGFHINASHISAPQRLSRLLIASCLAYIWIVFLGVSARQGPWPRLLHRQHRCDLSLFQLGLGLVAYCLCEGLPIPKGFLPPPLTLSAGSH
ncbi:MAG: transposase [Chloroflexi bacterium]|nr:transposase [Chloroflexota bacterium]